MDVALIRVSAQIYDTVQHISNISLVHYLKILAMNKPTYLHKAPCYLLNYTKKGVKKGIDHVCHYVLFTF